jgi:hypothetical protein
MKIKEEQLNKIKDQQKAVNEIVNNIGLIETQKHALLHELALVNEEVSSYKKELEDEYGSVTIDLSDGSYKEVVEEPKEKVLTSV